MNFTSLQYFLVTAEELNITRAAAKLYISQQALSSHINKLERTLGVALFERSPGLSLTYAGRQLADYAAKAINLERQIYQTASDISNNQRGEIRLGISHTCGRAILPSILPEYHAKHPLIDIRLQESNSEVLETLLQKGDLDFVITYGPLSIDGIESEVLVKERLFVVVPKTMLQRHFGACYDAIRSECSSELDLTLFGRLPFILLNKGNRLRTFIDQYTKEIAFHPNVILETENIETAFSLAQNGMGITLYPELFHWCIPQSYPLAEDPVEYFPLPGENAVDTLVIARMKDRYQTQAAKEFVATCKQVLEEIRRKWANLDTSISL